MESTQSFVTAEEGDSRKKRGRLMGKLFGKDRKVDDGANAASVDAFLHSSIDTLSISHPPPSQSPQVSLSLPKLDTSIPRFPQAQQNRSQAAGGGNDVRSPRRSPRPSRRGLTVRFDETCIEVIGEGGDESEMPTMEISKRKKERKQPPPPTPPQARPRPSPSLPSYSNSDLSSSQDDFVPKPISRTQTGYSANSSQLEPQNPGRNQSSGFLGVSSNNNTDENRKSFIEIHQAQMALAEGRAFAKAARTASAASEHDWGERKLPPSRELNDSPEPTSPEAQARPTADYSPVTSISTSSGNYPSPSNQTAQTSLRDNNSRRPSGSSQSDPPPRAIPSMASRALSVRVTDAVAGSEALKTFVARSRHLFALFRLHAEQVRTLSSCSQSQLARGSLWWFLKGRMGLEAAIRDRPTSPQSQMQLELDRQQAHSNLAKSYWLCQEVLPDLIESQGLDPDPEVADVAKSVVTALTKLAVSMKRNQILPPEDAVLPQTIDKSIWVEYPPLSQDMIALLTGNWGGGLTAMQHPMTYLELLDAFPVGDTAETFCYGRLPAEVFLMEQGRENKSLRFPCMLSLVRPTKQNGLIFVLSSQDGNIQLPIQDRTSKGGPSWEDIRWRPETSSFDLRLPRGFKLAVQLTQSDYRMLYNMYDYAAKLQQTLQPRPDEQVVFRNTLRSFQYLDADPNSRAFPKEPISSCDVALFEKLRKDNGPQGQRCWHTGFRIAVVTGPKTRTACGVSHTYPPPLPVQFGFFRAEGDLPAFSVKFENGRQKGRMVMVFGDEKERARFHSLLTGTSIEPGEKVFTDVPVSSVTIAQSLREPLGMAPFSRLQWKAGRVVNDEYGAEGDAAPTVLADRLRIILEHQYGTITDRINVEPGELRMRLEVSNAKVLKLLRQPQQDVTIAIAESQVGKDVPRNMYDSLQLIRLNQTIRSIEFNNLKDLHAFQYAVFGFEVIFDALAVTFAIARRRMVVPIHKKWEAGYTRIQVIKQEDKQLQLLAFFEDFSHGHCMNFVLKGTDLYEAFHRGSKSGIRFVDAKFPLPRLPADKDGDYDDMAFVCLDLPDLPGEHDDISIMFENEEDRDRLAQVLPAPIKGSSRISRMK
ncbi:hypothetical protein BBK36DRAFT_1170063 [Trichoderma citrinoviride]|uniref:Uncharacterized protein n=1 Tax=Trichoderma citrinoviride TaxID=58853 RepID=A0A2T4B7L0_9HYPO|nr:hypothetical protein BBK36DRAFT_1170063 [Trichoderma citrinoviride]PTB65323.1 hypothetical protein BBK36DRAFT_1170063 [Trichoderma citrinoviride]